MKHTIVILILVVSALSCGKDEKQKPDIIAKKDMVGILLDIHLTEARVSQAKLPLDSALTYYKFKEKELYEKYNIDSALYKRSMDYYTLNIGELDDIYEKVLDSLNILSAKEGAETR